MQRLYSKKYFLLGKLVDSRSDFGDKRQSFGGGNFGAGGGGGAGSGV